MIDVAQEAVSWLAPLFLFPFKLHQPLTMLLKLDSCAYRYSNRLEVLRCRSGARPR